MCLQDLRIARHTNARIIVPVVNTAGQWVIPPNPDRWGFSFRGTTTTLICTFSDLSVMVTVPFRVGSDAGGLRQFYVDLTVFPAMNQVQLFVANPDLSQGVAMLEQYYDSALSLLVQGDV